MVSKEWTAQWKTNDQPVWTRIEHDAHVVGVRVHDVLGRAVGSLALRYSRAAFDREVRAMAVRIAGLCAATVVLVSLTGTVLAVILTSRLRKRLQRMQLTLEDSGQAQPVGNDPSAADLTRTADEAREAVAPGHQGNPPDRGRSRTPRAYSPSVAGANLPRRRVTVPTHE